MSQQPTHVPRRAPAPVSLALPEAADEDAGTSSDFWSVWRDAAMRGAPIETGEEAAVFRRLARPRQTGSDQN
ncbi:MAG: hypothetical protein RIB45_13410 [Marivibrio sp.]|uniref:hypothetical protein n=1 Tax=Marivibrio sp. TaxID=2039719 RepID=UPI0032EABD16